MNSINRIKPSLVKILKKNGVVKAGVFGSFAKGKPKKSSDIDLLVKFKGRKSLLDLVGLQQELEEKFGKKFDLLTYNSISYLLKDAILKEEVRIL